MITSSTAPFFDAWSDEDHEIDARNNRKAGWAIAGLLFILTFVTVLFFFPATTEFVSEAIHTFLDTSASATPDATSLTGTAQGGKTG